MKLDIKVDDLLDQIAAQIIEKARQSGVETYHLIGIKTGGVWLANALKQRLAYTGEVGELNISFYRDDFSRIGLHPEVGPSRLPTNIDNQHIVLIDDVLMSGRTIRAAMNEIFDYGRPASSTLAVLLDLNKRELPIQAQIVGQELSLAPKRRVKLVGPEQLHVIEESLA